MNVFLVALFVICVLVLLGGIFMTIHDALDDEGDE